MKKFLSVRDLMTLTGMSRSQIVLDIRLGKLPAQKVGKQYIISGSNAEKYIASRTKKPGQDSSNVAEWLG